MHVSRRAGVVGLLCVIVLSITTPLSDMLVQSTWLASCHLPIGAFVLFLAQVTLLNTVLVRVRRRLGLQRHELASIYAMMLVGAGIPSFGLAAYLIPTLAGADYFATPENGWVAMFYKHVPRWLVPWDPHSATGRQPVTRDFYLGLHAGEPIPWRAWVVPLAAWIGLAMLLFYAYFCISAILRKQWADRERLAFPLVQLPAEILRSDPVPTLRSTFFRSRLMWLGFCVPAVVHSINSLHYYFPTWPQIPLQYDIGQSLVTFPWTEIGILRIWTHFSVIGLTYLLAGDLSLSLWLFFLLSKLQSVVAASYGMQTEYMASYPVPAFQAHEMLGGFVALAAMMIWLARGHLRGVWDAAGRTAVTDYDHGEPMTYRSALLGLAGVTAAACAWCWLAGMSFLMPIIALLMLYVVALVLTRFVSEGGLLFIQAPFQPTSLIAAAVGSRGIGAQDLVLLSYIERILIFDLRAFVMPSILDSYRVADTAALDRRRLTRYLMLSVVVASIVSCIAVLWITYRYGGMRLQPWFLLWSPPQPWNMAAAAINEPRRPSFAYWSYTLAGAVVTWALYALRIRFAWWPLHPIGFVMGPSWPMIQLWFSTLVGWTLKTSILRWWGQRGFAQARPFFLGLILGEYATTFAWLLIDLATGQRGNMMFLT